MFLFSFAAAQSNRSAVKAAYYKGNAARIARRVKDRRDARLQDVMHVAHADTTLARNIGTANTYY